MEFRLAFSSSVKNVVSIFIWIALNPCNTKEHNNPALQVVIQSYNDENMMVLGKTVKTDSWINGTKSPHCRGYCHYCYFAGGKTPSLTSNAGKTGYAHAKD